MFLQQRNRTLEEIDARTRVDSRSPAGRSLDTVGRAFAGPTSRVGISLKGVLWLVLRLEEIVGRELSEHDIEKLQSVEDVDQFLKSA